MKLYIKSSTSYCQLISCTKNVPASIPSCALLYRPVEVLPVAAHSFSAPQKSLIKIHLFFLKEIKQTSHTWCGKNPWQQKQQKQQICSAATLLFCFLCTNPTWASGLCISCWVELQFNLLWLPSRERIRAWKMFLDHSGGKQECSDPLEVTVRTVWGSSPCYRCCICSPCTKMDRVLLLHSVAHLDLPADRKEYPGLTASPLTEELSHCKIKATPCPQDRGTWRFLDCRKESGLQNK